MKNINILLVDDEVSQRLILKGHLQLKNYNVYESSSGEEAISIIKENIIDIIISDFKMEGMNGIELLQKAKELNPEISFIIITAFGTIDDAVRALKSGAYEYLTKPIDLDELDSIIEKIVERQNLISENKYLKEILIKKSDYTGIIAQSEKMMNVMSMAMRVADSKASVLITGESGTGKELIAKAIHYASPRKDKPFIATNCAALNENLLESELFGYEKGAFTGADFRRRGRFEVADGGTLFLDEIGDMSLNMQVKILRALQEQKFERVGGSVTIKVDVRILAATNQNLLKLIEENKFREDLYYRLNVISIEIPPLRNRKEDIPFLIKHFISMYLPETKRKSIEFSKEAMDILLKYDYPGNVRELENIIHHITVLAREDMITSNDLPAGLRDLPKENLKAKTLPEKVDAFEKSLIIEALEKSRGNQSQAARALGISERNLRYKLIKFGLK